VRRGAALACLLALLPACPRDVYLTREMPAAGERVILWPSGQGYRFVVEEGDLRAEPVEWREGGGEPPVPATAGQLLLLLPPGPSPAARARAQALLEETGRRAPAASLHLVVSPYLWDDLRSREDLRAVLDAQARPHRDADARSSPLDLLGVDLPALVLVPLADGSGRFSTQDLRSIADADAPPPWIEASADAIAPETFLESPSASHPFPSELRTVYLVVPRELAPEEARACDLLAAALGTTERGSFQVVVLASDAAPQELREVRDLLRTLARWRRKG